MEFGERLTESSRTAWRTPPEIVALVEKIYGGWITLDPCASADTKEWLARVNYHPGGADDGMTSQWFGNVYANPPYGRQMVRWIEKGMAARLSRDVDAIIWLVPARLDTRWWDKLISVSSVFAVKRGRLKFVGAPNCAMFPSALVYVGQTPDKFITELDRDEWTIYKQI